MEESGGTSQNNVNCLKNIYFHWLIKMKKRLNLILEFLNPKDIKPYKCFLQPYSSLYSQHLLCKPTLPDFFFKKFIQLPFRQFFEIDRFHLMRFKRTIPLTSAQKDFTSVANCENKIVCFLKLKHLLLRYKKIALFTNVILIALKI